MNREQLQRLASEWVRLAKNDIRTKAINFMDETDSNPSELAYHLGLSEGEIRQIIEGNGEITISTFAKLLIATGNALEIKPISETPIGNYENTPCEEELQRPLPRQEFFERNRFDRPSFSRDVEDEDDEVERPTFSRDVINDDEFSEVDFTRTNPSTFAREMARRAAEEHFGREISRNAQPRDSRGRFASRNHQTNNSEVENSNGREISSNTQPRDSRGRFASRNHQTDNGEAENSNGSVGSPFDNMSTDRLTSIIKERLWDSEINLNTATKQELINFLKEKDRRMNEYKRVKALENDPKVIEFKERMKKTIKNNPHLHDWVKQFLGKLEN